MFCIDLRNLNNKALKESMIDSTLHLNLGYWQVDMTEECNKHRNVK